MSDEGIYFEGDMDAPILVVCDPPSIKNWQEGYALSDGAYRLVERRMREINVDMADVAFIVPCSPLPAAADASDAKQRDHLKLWQEEFDALVTRINPRCIVPMGKLAARQVSGRATKITKVRGQLMHMDRWDCPVLPMLSPNHVIRLPANEELFQADFRMLEGLIANDYNMDAPALAPADKQYEFRFDISDIVERAEAGEFSFISVDAESTGLDWFRKEVVPLCVQIGYEEGKAVVVPLHMGYWNEHREAYAEHLGEDVPVLTREIVMRLRRQLKRLLGNPKVRKVGHNFKIDHHFLREAGIDVAGWAIDTMLMAFLVDENMAEKSLDECVRRWVPDMAGYADLFNQTTDKSRMIDVPLHEMLEYSAGDADATFRLTKVIQPLAAADKKNWQCYKKIILPAMGAFMDVVEPEGLPVNPERLAELQAQLDIRVVDEYQELIEMVPPVIRRRHAKIVKGKEVGLKFSRANFVIDILFSEDGFNLEPRVFTKSTQRLPDNEKVPSTSAKDHLPYFSDVPFVAQYMDFTRLEKMRSTYVGVPNLIIPQEGDLPDILQEATGFWKYIYNGKIHPSFLLHRTVTGRTASANPNAQNFPKRGKGSMKEVVKAFRRVFQAPPGWKILEADLSQAELRVAAWMANEQTMINLYQNGADVHAATAARTMGLTMEQFLALDKDTRDMKRFQAKAINFGFLYGMWWRKFMAYAKTDYGIDVSEHEAQSLREAFFELYPMLARWHDETKDFAREHGYVRALHGAIRHLPNIFSPEDSVKQESERQAVNSPVQRFASDLGLSAMSRIARDCPKEIIKPIAFIHDAVVALVREDYVEEAASAIKFYMESPPLYEWFNLIPPLPIVSDVSVGDNMADVEEMKTLQAYKPDWYQWWEDDRTEQFEFADLYQF